MAGQPKPLNVGDKTLVTRAIGPQVYRPCYFLSMKGENIRCFGEKQALDLSDGRGRPARWTVLLGDNGVGKTTLLECLALMQPLPVVNPKTGATAGIPRFGAPVHGIPNAVRYWRRGTTRLDLSCEAYCGEPLSQCTGAAEKLPLSTNVIYGGKEPAVNGSGPFPYGRIGGLVCYGYGAARRMRMGALTGEEEQDGCSTLLYDDVALLNAEEWFARNHLAVLDAKDKADRARQNQAQAQLDQVETMLMVILPGARGFRLVESGRNAGLPKMSVEVNTDYGWVSIRDLSLGYRTMIAWTVDLARRLFERYPDSPDPLAEPAIALVDEIDLHLHPKWQRSLMQFLTERFTNTQFIVTAHSPLVVQAAEGANVVVLRREGDHVVIDNDPKAIQGWRIDQVLTSDLFGLESARPPREARLLAERAKLASKSTLTEAEKARFEELEKALADLPTGETREDREAMDIIRRAAAELKQRGAGHNDPHP
ncbi:MAG: hypothetical protein FJ291_12310 [Planctomycetes bacterium]|nr:hypothetical protein [Planctomycetota bacterium]